MAKYLNSTGVSLLWNKIKELILDKIASIVPFVYVSYDGNELSESQKAHNLKAFENSWYNTFYAVVCFSDGTIYRRGTIQYTDDNILYNDGETELIYAEYNSETGNLKLIDETPKYYMQSYISGIAQPNNNTLEFIDSNLKDVKCNGWAFAIYSPYGSHLAIKFGETDIFLEVYLSKEKNNSSKINNENQANNIAIVKYLSNKVYNTCVTNTIVICRFIDNNLQCLGYIQGNKVYVPDFEKSLFEVYEITETATTRIEDVPFANAYNMWSGLDQYGSTENPYAPFVYNANDIAAGNMNTQGDSGPENIIFGIQPGKEAIYAEGSQFRTIPTGGEVGQTLVCTGKGIEHGYDVDTFVDVSWQDNFEQTLGNGLVINVPLFALDKIENVVYSEDSYIDATFDNNFIVTANGESEINIAEDYLIFKNTLQGNKYKSRFDSLYAFDEYFSWYVYEITLNSNTSKSLTFETYDEVITFNPGETKEVIVNWNFMGSIFTSDGNWTIKIKSIKFVYAEFTFDEIKNFIDDNWPLTSEKVELFTYSNLKNTIKNINLSNEEIDNSIVIINNRLDDQVPVKISYADGNIIFESESQKIAFPMANSYTTYDQYVTGFATGDLNIQQGATIVPVDKNGRFKRVFPYDTTTSMPSFESCGEVTYIDMSRFDTKKITSMRNTFKNCYNLTYLNISGWDISNVTGPTDFIFNGCSQLKHIDVSNWDTSGSTDMKNMFAECGSLEDIDVSNWDTSNVVDMRDMFKFCHALKELNVSNWNVAKVTTMERMFDNCDKLQTLNFGDNWNMDKVTNTTNMFIQCINLTTVTGTISNLKKSVDLRFSPLTNASAMVFINGIAENGSGVTLTFKKSTYDTLTAEQKAIATSKGATITYAN